MRAILLGDAVLLASFAIFATYAAQTLDHLHLPASIKADLEHADPHSYTIEPEKKRNIKHGKQDYPAKGDAPNGLNGLLMKPNNTGIFVATFDDGPWINHRKVFDTATKNDLSGITFFVNADNYGCIYDEERVADIKYSFERGATFCSHTATHPYLDRNLTHQQLTDEMEHVEVALWKILGVVPQCMRPPYGHTNDTVVKFLNDRGYAVILWSIDSGDSVGLSPEQSLDIISKLKSPNSTDMLTHETINTTANTVFPKGVPMLIKNGFKPSHFVDVGKAYGFHPYKVIGKPQKRDHTWNCDNIVPLGKQQNEAANATATKPKADDSKKAPLSQPAKQGGSNAPSANGAKPDSKTAQSSTPGSNASSPPSSQSKTSS